MSKAGWAAIIAAIAFPTVALVVVLLIRPPPPPPPAFPPPGADWSPGSLRKGGGKAPPFDRGAPPPPLDDEALVQMKQRLELTDEQIDQIWKTGQPARRRMVELDLELRQKEQELRQLLSADEPEEDQIDHCLKEINDFRLERDRIAVLTPLKLRKILTPEQQTKLTEVWRDQIPLPPPGKAPPFWGKAPPGGHRPPPPWGKAGPRGFGPPPPWGKAPPPPMLDGPPPAP